LPVAVIGKSSGCEPPPILPGLCPGCRVVKQRSGRSMGCRTLPTYVRAFDTARGHPVDLPARRGHEHFGVKQSTGRGTGGNVQVSGLPTSVAVVVHGVATCGDLPGCAHEGDRSCRTGTLRCVRLILRR
jgi:hypothetical protein